MKSIKYCFLILFAASAAHGAVTVGFLTSNVFGPATQTGTTLTLNFTVSGTGVVSLDATGNNANAANIANYNQLDNANVGTVSSSDAYGKTFSIVITAKNGTGGETASHLSTVGLGIVGNNAGRIDWSPTAGQVSEMSTMTFNLANLTGLTLSLSNVLVQNTVDGTGAVASARIKSFGSSIDNYGTGSIDLTSGFQAPGGANGATIEVSQATQATAGLPGFSITSMTFDVIPEPSSTLLGGLGALALLRRRRS